MAQLGADFVEIIRFCDQNRITVVVRDAIYRDFSQN